MIPEGFSSLEFVSQGTSSTVYKAVHNITQEVVALKSFDVGTFDPADLNREMSCHRNLEHPFITRFFGSTSVPGRSYIVMEYVGRDSLFSTLQSSGAMLEFEAERIFAQLISALYYLHNHSNIAHGDVKLENIMLDARGDVKLIDFGVSRVLSSSTHMCCGSMPSCAPEILCGGEYTKAVDVWAAGVCLFVMLAGRLPFPNDDVDKEAFTKSVTSDEPEYPSQITEEARDLLSRMLDKNSSTRITTAEIVRHPWIQGSRFIDDRTQALLADFNFRRCPKGVDNRVLKALEGLGFATESIPTQIQNGIDTDATMAYRILKLRTSPDRRVRMHRKFGVALSSPFFEIVPEQAETKKMPPLSSSTSHIEEQTQLPTLSPERRRGSLAYRSTRHATLAPIAHEQPRSRMAWPLALCKTVGHTKLGSSLR